MKRPEAVHVTWKDAESDDDWLERGEVVDALPDIETVGFLIKRTKKVLVVSLNFDASNDRISMTMRIPIKWCVKIRKLRL